MTELSFAKSFLSTLDARPIKLQSDHVADPKTLELKGPLKSLRSTPPPFTLSLPNTPLSTSIFALKERVAAELSTSPEAIKLLHARKPAGDAKTVAEVIGEEGGGEEVEFGVMVMGLPGGGKKGEGGEEKKEVGKGAVAQGASGEEVMGSDAFWDDLRGWLMQRVRDEGMAGEAWGLFKRGWDER
ncbi:MAG: hypothetical protein Q9185_006846 [Variospora sp. 1 TL-2023]